MIRAAALCLFAPLGAGPALAQVDCRGTTQVEANFCAKARWEAADAELNRIWAVVKPAADARGEGAALLAAQRAWLQRRDSTCEPELTSGGSADAMFYWSCMEDMTRGRNAELRALR